MALVFKVGEHEEFPPVPKDFPRCESYMPSGPPEVMEASETSVYKLNTNNNKKMITTPNPEENEVDNVEKVQDSIKTWLPLVLKELGVQSSASTSISQYLVLGLSVIFTSINHLRMQV